VPVKPTLLERWAGGSSTPWWLPEPKGGEVTVVVVVGATTAVVVVVAGAAAGGTVVGTVAACVDVSEVAAVFAAGTDAVVVVAVERTEPLAPPDPPAPPAPPALRVPCASLDCALAIPCVPAPWATRFGSPAVATRRAIRARDTARMTHQLGRPRAALGSRPPEDPVP